MRIRFPQVAGGSSMLARRIYCSNAYHGTLFPASSVLRHQPDPMLLLLRHLLLLWLLATAQEMSCVGLVAVAPLQSGAEVLFNYRLSPALKGRPAWYVPVDHQEENMRWA